MGVSDVIADDGMSLDDRAARGGFAGCISGALTFGEYRAGLEAAGLVDIAIEPTHGVASGLHGAIIRATKPASWAGVDAARLAAAVPSPAATRDLAFSGDLCDCDCEALGCC